jgi:hypothetical protein
MPTLRESTTAVIVRGENWEGSFASEPFEAGWATEAVLFLRLLKQNGDPAGAEMFVDISPDGMSWVREGARISIPQEIGEIGFVKVSHFGNWLRVSGKMPASATCQALVTLHLK